MEKYLIILLINLTTYILTFAATALKKSASPYVVRPSGFVILPKVVADSGFFRDSQYFFYLA